MSCDGGDGEIALLPAAVSLLLLGLSFAERRMMMINTVGLSFPSPQAQLTSLPTTTANPYRSQSQSPARHKHLAIGRKVMHKRPFPCV
jgi:hypothetical protein